MIYIYIPFWCHKKNYSKKALMFEIWKSVCKILSFLTTPIRIIYIDRKTIFIRGTQFFNIKTSWNLFENIYNAKTLTLDVKRMRRKFRLPNHNDMQGLLEAIFTPFRFIIKNLLQIVIIVIHFYPSESLNLNLYN